MSYNNYDQFDFFSFPELPFSRNASIDNYFDMTGKPPRKFSGEFTYNEPHIQETAPSLNVEASSPTMNSPYEFDHEFFSGSLEAQPSPSHHNEPIHDEKQPELPENHAEIFQESSETVLKKRKLVIDEEEDLGIAQNHQRVQKKVKSKLFADLKNPEVYEFNDVRTTTEDSDEQEYLPERAKKTTKSSKKSGKAEDLSEKKLKIQKGILKNYISTTSNAFGSLIVMEGQVELREILQKRVNDSQGQVSQDEILQYIRKNIEGKVPKSTQSQSKWRQYKVSTRKEVGQIFQDSQEDCPKTRGTKKVLREIITDFFRSKTYIDWVFNYYETEIQEYRDFLANKINVEELINIYCRPNWRAHFETC